MMKQYLFSLRVALSLGVLAMLCGCSDSTTTQNSTPAVPFIAATVDGAVWRTENLRVTHSNGVLEVEGIQDNQTIQFRIVEKFMADRTTLSLGETHNALLHHGSTIYNSFLSPTGGSFTITLLTKSEMEGTFSFAGTDNKLTTTLHVLGGQFRIPLPQ